MESYSWLKPWVVAVRFLLVLKFRFTNALLRTWLCLRLVALRLQRGKKLVVLYRDVGIGDIVCTFPLIAELRKLFPHQVVVYVTQRRFHSFVRRFSRANAVVGTSYVLYSEPLPRLPAWVADKSLHPLYGDEKPAGPKKERSSFSLEMAESCGVSLTDPLPKLTVDEAEASLLLRRHDPEPRARLRIGIHTGPSLPVKEWPIESWRQLVQLLHQQLGAAVFQFGSKWHLSHPTETKGSLPVQCDLTGRLDLIETTHLISKMDLFIGIDSGLLHIANAAGVRSIGLFGPTNPYVVLGGQFTTGLFSAEVPCIFCQHRGLDLHWKTGCPYDIRCLGMLSADAVFASVKMALDPTLSTQNSDR
jgi:ADP-heptose:LPS heptosyltransferase